MFTQDGQREAEKLNLEDSTVCVEDQRKIVEKQLHDAALVNYEEHMRDHHDRLKLMSNRAWAKNQSNDTERRNLPNDWVRTRCTLAMFWSGTRFGSGGARMEKRTRKEAEWKLRTRRDPSLASRVVHFAHGAAQRCAEKLSWWYRFSSLPCVMQRQVSQSRVFRKCGSSAKCRKSKGWSMSLSWCIGFSPPLFKKKGSLSPSESFVKNQIARSVRIVFCERRPGRKNQINVVSSRRIFVTSFHTMSPFLQRINSFLSDGKCTQNTSHLTHIFLSALPVPVSLFVFAVLSRRFSHAQHVRVAQGTSYFLWSTCLARIPTEHSLSTHHVSPWCSDSVYFLFDSTTIPDTFSTDADWNQIKPLHTPPRGWAVLALWLHDIPPHPFRELCEEPDRMFSKNCVVWTSTWA